MIGLPDSLPPVEYWPCASVRLSGDGLWQPAEADDGMPSTASLLKSALPAAP